MDHAAAFVFSVILFEGQVVGAGSTRVPGLNQVGLLLTGCGDGVAALCVLHFVHGLLTGQDGGGLGYILEGTVKDFDDALKAISVGKTSKTPTKTQFGFHVFKVDDRRKPRTPAFKDVKKQLTAQVQQKAFIEMVKRLRDGAKIEIIEQKS